MHIQDWFSNKRTDLGYSLEELSNLSGLASSQIHNIEHGESKTTINAIVRLCFALDISINEFFSVINIPLPGNYLDIQAKPNNEIPFITAIDMDEMLSFYNRKGYATIIKGFAYQSFYQVVQLAPPQFSAYKKIGAAYNMVGQAIKSTTPNVYIPLPYPGIIHPDHYYLVSLFGMLTTNDFGAYLKSIRKTQMECSVREVGKQLKMSHSTISRIENGESDLSLFSDLYKMEIVLSQNYHNVLAGYTLYIRWLVEEFKTGIVRNRKKELSPPPKEWIWRDYVLADTLIRISRWYTKYDCDEKWMEQLRSFLKKLNKGEIPPFTTNENIYGLSRPTQNKPAYQMPVRRDKPTIEEMKKLFEKTKNDEVPMPSE